MAEFGPATEVAALLSQLNLDGGPGTVVETEAQGADPPAAEPLHELDKGAFTSGTNLVTKMDPLKSWTAEEVHSWRDELEDIFTLMGAQPSLRIWADAPPAGTENVEIDRKLGSLIRTSIDKDLRKDLRSSGAWQIWRDILAKTAKDSERGYDGRLKGLQEFVYDETVAVAVNLRRYKTACHVFAYSTTGKATLMLNNNSIKWFIKSLPATFQRIKDLAIPLGWDLDEVKVQMEEIEGPPANFVANVASSQPLPSPPTPPSNPDLVALNAKVDKLTEKLNWMAKRP
jgi:hypothetical protein